MPPVATNGTARDVWLILPHHPFIVISKGVVELHAQILLRLPIQIKETGRTLPADGQGVKNVIATLDREITFDGAGLFEALISTFGGIQFRLQMRVLYEQKWKIARVAEVRNREVCG